MGNLFDDVAPEAPNLFDDTNLFDEEPQVYGKDEGVMGAKRYREQLAREDSYGERLKANIQSGWEGSFAGILTNDAAPLLARLKVLQRLENKGRADYSKEDEERAAKLRKELEPQLTAYRRKRSVELAEEFARPNWYDDPKLLGKIMKGSTSLIGQIIGGAPSPENLIPVGRGASMFKNFLKGAAVNAPLGGSSDLVNQMIDVELGVRKEIDWKQVAAGTAAAGVVGGALNLPRKGGGDTVTGNEAADKLKQRIKDPTEAKLEKDQLDTFAGEGNVPDVEVPGQYMQPRPDGGLPNLFDEFVDDTPTLSQPADLIAGNEGPLGPLPGKYTPPELDPPLRESRLIHPDPATEPHTDLPLLQDYPEPYMTPGRPDVDDRNTLNNPYIPNAVDLENAQRYPDPGAHSEMSMLPEPQDPIIGPDATRSYDDGVAQDIENKTMVPNLAQHTNTGELRDFGNTHVDLTAGASARAGLKPHHMADFTEFTPQNPEYATRMKQAADAHDALSAIIEFGTDGQKKIANYLKRFADDVGVMVVPDSMPNVRGYRGTFITMTSGKRIILLNSDRDGLSPTVLLHEMKHAATEDAHSIAQGRNSSKPEYRRHREYHEEVKRIHTLFEEQYKKVDKSLISGRDQAEIDYALSKVEEFDAQMTSVPIMRELARRMAGGTIWERMKRAWHKFLGQEHQLEFASLFDRFVLNESRLEDLQLSRDERAKYAQEWLEDHKSPLFKAMEDKVPPVTVNLEDALRLAKGKDIPGAIPQNVLTTNQLLHPVVAWTVDKMGTIFREASPRFHHYKEELKPFMFDRATRLTREQQVGTFKTLVDIQSPSLKEARAQAEANGTQRQFLAQHGLEGRQLDFAEAVLRIMQDVHKKDIESLKRLGRDLAYEPMYFPRTHGGRFIVKVLDQNGIEQYVKGFESFAQARVHQAALQNGLNDRPDLRVQSVERAARDSFGDDFSQILLEHEVFPLDFMKKGARAIENARETAPFSFEKQRRDTDVGGYVGEVLDGKKEEERLLQVLSRRLQSSRNLETKSKIITEIKRPLFDGASLGEQLRLRLVLGNMINRELGADISGVKGSDAKIQEAVELIGKLIPATKDLLRGERFNWETKTTAADAAKRIVRAWTYTTSMLKLGLNVPVLATNFTQNSLLPMDGIRTAKLEQVPADHALVALWRTMAYIGHHKESAHAFMVKAREQGMIEPHGQEHYTIADLPDRNRFDKMIQYPRDRIEQFTNYASILYYYHFYESAMPHLKGVELENKVYRAARSFTGQYDQYAGPVMFDKAGTAGQLFTNFSKWHFNQLGRLINDVRALGEQKSVVPILTSVMMAAVSAGLYGLPIVVEYESIRRLGMYFDLWDIPPISALGEKGKEYIPHWDFMERGLITAGSDAVAKLLGANSGPDLSGSMRFSAFLDMPTVAIQQFVDIVFKLVPTAYKEWFGNGASAKEIEDAMRGAPPALKTAAKKLQDSKRSTPLWQKRRTNVMGEKEFDIMDPSSGQKLYTLSDIEDTYNLFNIKSRREAKELDAIYYHKWLERDDKKELQKANAAILSHIGNKDIYEKNIRKMLLPKEEGGLGLGQQAIRDVHAEIRSRMTDSQFDYFMTQWRQVAKQSDAARRHRDIENIRKARSLRE